jgi:hypothetical protein
MGATAAGYFIMLATPLRPADRMPLHGPGAADRLPFIGVNPPVHGNLCRI